MTERVSFEEFDREVAAFQVRLQELRTQRMLGSDGPSGDEAAAAAFLELETAAEELRVAHEELWAAGNELARRNVPGDRDRDVLRVVFRDLPVAVILLDRSGRIRRVNQRAVDLLGVTADYLSGKPFPVFVDLPARAALRSLLAAVARGKDQPMVPTSLLRLGRPIPVRLALSTVQVPSDSRPVVMAVVLPGDGETTSPRTTPAGEPSAATTDRPLGKPPRPDAIRAITRRLDLVTGVASLLLGEEGSTAALLHGMARLLCDGFADWVCIDMIRDGHMTRAAVCGPSDRVDPAATSTLNALERANVGKSDLPGEVMESRQSRLEAHLEDTGLLGEDDRGVPFLSAMGAHSILCVAIAADGAVSGAITAVRTQGSEPFSLSEQAALEDVATLLALPLRSDRRVARRAHGIHGIRAALSPRSIATPRELDVASLHRVAGPEGSLPVSFLDFHPSLSGWGAALADTLGDGEPATMYLAMVRQWVRLLALTEDDPDRLLRQLNWAMRRLAEATYPVAATAMHVDIVDDRAQLRLASAGYRSSLALRTDGRVQRVDGGGEPLCGGEEALLHADSIALDPGDQIFLFNDALYETRNSVGDTFGDSGQLRIALARATGGTAQDALDSVAEALSLFADNGLQLDVLAMTVRFTGT